MEVSACEPQDDALPDRKARTKADNDAAAVWCGQANPDGSRRTAGEAIRRLNEDGGKFWPLARSSSIQDRVRAADAKKDVEEATKKRRGVVAAIAAATAQTFGRGHRPLLDSEERFIAHQIVVAGRLPALGGLDRTNFRRLVEDCLQLRRHQTSKTPGEARPIFHDKVVEYEPRVPPLNHNAYNILDGSKDGCSDDFIRAFTSAGTGFSGRRRASPTTSIVRRSSPSRLP
jgi:hypothetical protein